MRDGHRRIGVEQQLRHRLADDVRPADHHRLEPRQITQAVGQQHHATQRRAGDEAALADRKAAGIGDVEPVDVLVGTDRGDHRLFVEMVGKRQLDKDAVHRRIGVQSLDQREQFGLARIGGQAMFETFHVRRDSRLVLAAHIDLARGILAHQHHREPGLAPGCLRELLRLRADAFAQLGGKALPVDDLRAHQP